MADMLKSMMAAIGLAEDDAALWGSPTELATKDELLAARDALKSYDDVLRTPQLNDWPVGDTKLTLKLESLQTTGSFKIRGMRYKLHVSDAVSYLAGKAGIDAKVFMPDTAPDDRKRLMEDLGASVTKVPGAELLDAVAECVATEKRILVHPFDDVDLIRGHASCGLEMLEDQPDVDVVAVCCGGGGLLAGATYNHVRAFCDDVVTVTDAEMREATRALFRAGVVAEVSGAAAVAAALAGKLGDVAGKKVACTVSGRNIDVGEYEEALSDRPMSH
ncbi:serine racemase [Aureococcus anophagefferens]|nr:serine racemase [Aureococcus anophagefferens]